MRLIFHGILRDLFGPEATMHARSVADGIEGFSRQQEDWPRLLRVSAVGFDTVDKLAEKADEVHLMPAIGGGGGKFTSIIIGAALIVAGIISLPGPWGIPLILSGATMVLSGVVGLFMKAPSANAADPAASKILGVNKNTTANGTPMQMAWGRVLVAPHWLSIQSDSINLSHGIFPSTPT